MTKSKKGFTLVELIVVLAILAVIAAIAVPTAFGSIEKARLSADEASLEAYNSVIRIQAGLLAARTADPDNNIAKAIEAGGLSIPESATVDASKKGQSKDGIGIRFKPASGSQCASFVLDATATVKISSATTIYAALSDAVKETDANLTLETTPCVAVS